MVIGIIWVFAAIATVVVTPIYESRESLSQIGRGIVKVCSPSAAWGLEASVLTLVPLPFAGHVFAWKRQVYPSSKRADVRRKGLSLGVQVVFVKSRVWLSCKSFIHNSQCRYKVHDDCEGSF